MSLFKADVSTGIGWQAGFRIVHEQLSEYLVQLRIAEEEIRPAIAFGASVHTPDACLSVLREQ